MLKLQNILAIVFVLSIYLLEVSAEHWTTLQYNLWWTMGGLLDVKMKGDGVNAGWQSFWHYKSYDKVCYAPGGWCIQTGINFADSATPLQTITYKGVTQSSACTSRKVVSKPPVCLIGQPCPEITHWECNGDITLRV